MSGGGGATPTPTPTPNSGGGGRINHALSTNGGVATASSSLGSAYPPEATNDGDRKGLNWGSGGVWYDYDSLYPDWVQIDFAASESIDEINVLMVQDSYNSPIEPTLQMTLQHYGLADFQVQYWDGSNWTDVTNGVVTGNDKVWRQFTFTAVTTDKVRVLINQGMGGSRLVELEAWGS